MTETDQNPGYDLEERTFEFARAVRAFYKRLPKTIGNIEDDRQLVRASGSVGANYIEANEALSKKTFGTVSESPERKLKKPSTG